MIHGGMAEERRNLQGGTSQPFIPSPMALRGALPLALLFGGLYWAAFPGVGWWPLGYVAFFPLIVALRGQKPWVGALLGLAGGTIATFFGFFWLIDTFRTFGGFPTPIGVLLLLALSIFQAGRFALFASLFCAISKRGWPYLVAITGAFVTSEIGYPLLFPWFFGACLHAWPILIQTADVGGPVLVGLPLVIFSALLAQVCGNLSCLPTKKTLSRLWVLWVLWVLWLPLLLPMAYGALLIPFVDRDMRNAPGARIGLVQGNIPPSPAPPELLDQAFTEQVRRTVQLSKDGADLVFWPESAFIYLLPEKAPEEGIRATEVSSLGIPLLTGALLETDEDSPRVFNSALMMGRGGTIQGRYDKQRLLPFGEYIPLAERFPILHRISPASGRISKGSWRGPVPFEDKRITVLICYEDILPDFVRQAVREHRPHLLANLTNDGWFGESKASEIHLALAKLRAVEHRRFLVRSTNTGQTVVVDAVGREVVRAPAFVEASMVGEIRWMHGWTLYGWWGDLPWYLVGLGALGLAVMRRPLGWQIKMIKAKKTKDGVKAWRGE